MAIAIPPAMLPPPAANNAAFLAAYGALPAATQNGIEFNIWQALNPPYGAHDFGRQYIRNLTQHSYNVLPIVVQNAIAQEIHVVAAGALAPPAVMILFVNAMLP